MTTVSLPHTRRARLFRKGFRIAQQLALMVQAPQQADAHAEQYDRERLAQGIYVCRECHDAIHTTYTEMELAKGLASPEALLADPVLSRHFAWLSRQRRRAGPPGE